MLTTDRAHYTQLLKTTPPTTPPPPTTTTVPELPAVPAQLMLPATTFQRSERKKAAEQRELVEHARQLGCEANPSAVAKAELKAAQKLDPRVSPADLERAVDRARRAKDLAPVRQNVLCGFTRVVDAKLKLSPDVVSRLCADVGKDSADLLLAAIDKGPGPPAEPGAVAFPHPQSKVELVASLVRQLVLGKGASLQLPISSELAAWLEHEVATSGARLSMAMGGAGAFAANLMSALPNVRPRFFSKDPLPEKIADRFAARVELVGTSGATTTTAKHRDHTPARVNFSCEYDDGAALSVLGRTCLKINGEHLPLVSSGAGRVILGTKAKDVVPGFADVDDAALSKMGKEHDLFFMVGAHYLTQSSPAVAATQATELGRTLDVMKAANPKLVRHLQYVVPKVAAQEATVLGALKGHVESLSMNAVELPALIDRLHSAGLSRIDENPNLSRDLAEDAPAMITGARALKEALGLSRVHLHGLYGDLIVANAGDVDVDRTRLALLKARQLASMKAANDTGEIKTDDDIFDVAAVVQGRCLAAVHRFADALMHKHGFDDAARKHIVRDWVWTDPATNEVIFFVPSRGIHDRTGGTVSLGDTIDISALVFSKTEGRPKEHPQLVT
ncbi:MAG: ADP-dependent glucokinase/phosphofructokinase [Deltaproteobacteria bacterium]|nr:ADP-dependent glucokinase/phosphofructokinase [Deltaproteobacteria bacterium]